MITDVVLVARNQASVLAATLAALPRRHLRSAIVVDNGSTDSTAGVAHDAGAVVLREPRPGRGRSLRRAIAHLEALPVPPDVVVLMTADGEDCPAEIPHIVAPIVEDNAELVIGVPAGQRARVSSARLVKGLLATVYGVRVDDIGPFRAIRFPALVALSLRDSGAGVDVEMLVKAIKFGLHIAEVPVDSPARDRRGRSLDPVRLSRSLAATGRAIFYIVRHSTTR